MGRKLKYWLISLLLIISQLTINPLQVKAADYSFNNGLIRFDYISPSAINTTTGFLNQPYYHSSDGNWYKLTYSTYPLDYALAVGGDGSSEWNLDGSYLDTQGELAIKDGTLNIDASGLITANGLTYGKLITSGVNTVNGKDILVTNTFELGLDKSFVKITTKIQNQSLTETLTNLRYWVGTRDDWVGGSDGPTKTKGTIQNGVFTQIASTSTRSSAIQITTANEGVLFYTTEATANMSVNSCCSFSNATNQDPFSSTINTSGDGSYAMFIRLKDLAASAAQEVVWYYAAGALSNLASVVNDVASAASSFSSITYNSASFSVTSSVNSTGYYIIVPHDATAPSVAQIVAGVTYTGATVFKYGSQTLTANTAGLFNLSGLTEGNQYDVYFVSQYPDPQNSSNTLSTNISMTTLTTVAYGAPILAATGSASSITKTSATVGGEVTGDNSEGTAAVTQRGLCYSTSINPTTSSGTCTSVGTGLGTFSTTFTGLQSYTTYYVRAYAVNSYGPGYGTQSSFRTLETTLSTSLSGLSAPVTGQTRPASFSGTGYTASVVWSPASSDNKFHANIEYSATLTISPTTGYDLNGIALNTFTLASASTLTHSANSGVISATFPLTSYNQVIFNTNGGNSISSVSVDYGSLITQPSTPTKTGYTFGGWYTDNTTFNQAFNFASTTMGGSNLNLYVKWTPNPYTLTFNSNGGSAVSAITQQAGTSVSAPQAPSKAGYTFANWSELQDLSTSYTFSTMPGLDKTLYSKWTVNSYQISYTNNGGTSSNPSGYSIETPTFNLSPATKTGYTFVAWVDDHDLTITSIPLGSTGDLSLSATYTIGQYFVSFNTNQGSAIPSQTISYLSLVSPVSNPTRSGYAFDGWYKDANLQTPFDFTQEQVSANMTIYAKWNSLNFALTYDYAGGSGSNPSSYSVLDALDLGSATRDGYRFLGWLANGQLISSIAKGSTGDMSLQAQWIFVPIAPKIAGMTITNITTDTAQITATIVEIGNPKLTTFGYELVNLSDGTTTLGSLFSGLTTQLIGLNPYSNYSVRFIASNGSTTLYSEAVMFQPRLPDRDNDGIPDARDAYPDDASKSFSAQDIQPDKEPVRAFIGEKETIDATQYTLKLSEKDLMGLQRNENILVVMGSVQFIIPVTMVDTILSNSRGEDTYLTLKVEPQIIEEISQENLLEQADMNVLAAYDYLLFQVYRDGREEPIHQLGGKIKVGIGLNELEGEYDPNKMEVYFYNTDTGNVESMKAVYDPVTQSMVFLTEHFSYYILGIKKEDDPSSVTLRVLGLGIAIGMAIMWFILVGYRKLMERIDKMKR